MTDLLSALEAVLKYETDPVIRKIAMRRFLDLTDKKDDAK